MAKSLGEFANKSSFLILYFWEQSPSILIVNTIFKWFLSTFKNHYSKFYQESFLERWWQFWQVVSEQTLKTIYSLMLYKDNVMWITVFCKLWGAYILTYVYFILQPLNNYILTFTINRWFNCIYKPVIVFLSCYFHMLAS